MSKEIDILILRGAPGTGKSQVGKSLGGYFPNGVRLEVDTLRQMVISVDWTNQQEHIQLLEIAAGLVQGFLKQGFKPVIVIDTFSGNKLEKFLENIKGRKKRLPETKIIGLHCSEEELKKRLEQRKGDAFKDFEISRKLNKLTRQTNYDKETKIDTTDLEARETAQRIFQEVVAAEISA